MLLILEGPDGAGKTTLAQRVGELTGRRIVAHGAALGTDNLAALFWKTLDAAAYEWGERGLPYVVDRAWPSEPIYAAVVRDGKDRIGIAFRRMLERRMMTLQGVLVLCLPPYETCREGRAGREEYVGEETGHERVYEMYKTLAAAKPTVPTIVYDRTTESVESMLARAEAVKPPVPILDGFGFCSPGNAVILGSMPKSETPYGEYAFTSWCREGCSAWLAERLEAGRIPERRLFWMNALKRDGSDTDCTGLREFAEGGARVFALGTYATIRCLKESVPHTPCPHPSDWFKYRAKQTYPLVGLLQGFADPKPEEALT